MKNSRVIKKTVARQKYTFIFYNLLAYLIIFSVLGIVAVTSINMIFFRDARREVSNYETYLQSDKAKIFGPSLRPDNPRMAVSFYNEDGLIREFYGINVEVIIPEKPDLNKLNYELLLFDSTYEHVYFLTKIIKVSFPDEEIEYAKIYMNIDGEMTSRNEIIKVYIICVIAISLLSGIASYILSRQTLKPFVMGLEKQLTFVSDASHELRTPLAIVQSKIENVLTESDKTVYDVSEDLAIALKEIARLNRLTNDLLTLARSDNETTELELLEFNIDDLIKQALEPFAELAELQNKRIIYQGNSLIVNADRMKIYQLLIILLDNALLYTNEEDVIKVNLINASSEIIIEVIDSGMGISDFTKEHIFERFYREDQARNRATGGNGLGLSIAQSIVSIHRGKIYVDHNVPKGTKFTINLPKK